MSQKWATVLISIPIVSMTLAQDLQSRLLTLGILRSLMPPKASACNYTEASTETWRPLVCITFSHLLFKMNFGIISQCGDIIFPHLFKLFFCISFFFLIYFIYLFSAVLGLHCCTWAFSSCSELGLLFVAVRRLLTAVASPVVEHGL